MEIKLQNLLQGVYFVCIPLSPLYPLLRFGASTTPADGPVNTWIQGKTKDVLNDVRSFAGLERKKNEDALRMELVCPLLTSPCPAPLTYEL